MKSNRRVCICLSRGGIVAAEWSFVRIGNMGGENYCGNQVMPYRSTGDIGPVIKARNWWAY